MDMRGRWFRRNKKPLVDDYLPLDMATVAKRVDLEAPGSYIWLWPSTGIAGVRRLSISIVVVPGHGLRLRYRHNGEDIGPYPVPVVTTRPNYGGKRYWFLCPNQDCRRRVRILYGSKRFLCRHCHNLTYETAQTGGNLVVMIDSRLAFLRRKLGGRGSLLDVPLDKPSRMHFQTYMRLTGEYINLLRIREQAFTYEILCLLPSSEVAGDLPVTPKTLQKDLIQEWKAYKAHPDWRLIWGERLANQPPIECARQEKGTRLTLGKLAKRAGVSYAFAQETVHEGLLSPDGGRKTRMKRYRPKLATWLRKLYRLREAGLSWHEIRDWSRRRWQPEHEHERKWPAEIER